MELILLAALLGNPVLADTDTDTKDIGRKNAVTIVPRLVPTGATLRYQRAVTRWLSAQAGVGLASTKVAYNNGPWLDLKRVNVMVDAEFHPLFKGLSGLYIGPRVVWAQNSHVNPDNDNFYKRSWVDAVAMLGYQQVFGFGLVVGAGVGGGARNYVAESGDVTMLGGQITTDWMASFEFKLGWAF